MRQTTQSLKELYEKDFYLWMQENLRLLKNREYGLVDWENLLEEIEDIGKSLRRSGSSYSPLGNLLFHVLFVGLKTLKTHCWLKPISRANCQLKRIFHRSALIPLNKSWNTSLGLENLWREPKEQEGDKPKYEQKGHEDS